MQPTDSPVTAQTVTPARTLRAAADYLSRHGWVQGSLYDMAATVFTPAACLVGAIAMVCYGGPVDAPAHHYEAPEWADFDGAVAYLEEVLDWSGGVYGFNDDRGSDAECVISLLRCVANLWDEEHLRCPGCRKAAFGNPPEYWEMPECYPVPGFSHVDGTPLCPVFGSDELLPVLPVLVEGGA
jgi:hypothetical protein